MDSTASSTFSTLADGRYELLERIGRGAMGETYRARERVCGFPREVCIKRLAGEWTLDQARSLWEEGRLLASVRHSNVVSLYALGEEDDGTPFLVLELIKGLSLRELSEHHPRLPIAVAVHVACGLLRAIAAVQRALPGLVHRDVTPDNVLLSTEGEIKLSDFGIALARDRTRWTRPMHVKGKFGYVSPEQLRDERLDVRTDIFAVGVLLYELIAGVRPWGGLSRMDELHAIAQGKSIPLRHACVAVARELANVVETMIAASKNSRFGSPEEALVALACHGAGELGSTQVAQFVRGDTACGEPVEDAR